MWPKREINVFQPIKEPEPSRYLHWHCSALPSCDHGGWHLPLLSSQHPTVISHHGGHSQEPVFSYLASENIKQSYFLALRDPKTLCACVCTRVQCTHMWTCTCFRRTRRREKKRQNHQLRPQLSLPATDPGSRFSEWLLFTKHFKARPLRMWSCVCGFWCVKSPFWFVLIHI